jgi:hypothetical protein
VAVAPSARVGACLSLLFGLVALAPPNAAVVQQDDGPATGAETREAYGRFAGFYKLIGTERRGYLAYGPGGYMSMTTQAATGEYTAYFGTFAVNDAAATITHQFFGALEPRFTAADLERRFTMSGNRLTLRPMAAINGSPGDQTWERVPDLPDLTPAQRQLVGFWKLISTERRTTTGELARAYPGWTGFIVYAPSGHMMVHMMEPYRRRAAGSEYTSYFGTYSVTGPGTLIHHMEGSVNPRSVGTDTERFFEMSGTNLILRPPLIKTPQGDVVMTNVWEKLTD